MLLSVYYVSTIRGQQLVVFEGNAEVTLLTDLSWVCLLYSSFFELVYGEPNVPKTLANAVFIYPPLIYKYNSDLAKYLSNMCIYIFRI